MPNSDLNLQTWKWKNPGLTKFRAFIVKVGAVLESRKSAFLLIEVANFLGLFRLDLILLRKSGRDHVTGNGRAGSEVLDPDASARRCQLRAGAKAALKKKEKGQTLNVLPKQL